jgi:hypothetical protein
MNETAKETWISNAANEIRDEIDKEIIAEMRQMWFMTAIVKGTIIINDNDDLFECVEYSTINTVKTLRNLKNNETRMIFVSDCDSYRVASPDQIVRWKLNNE